MRKKRSNKFLAGMLTLVMVLSLFIGLPMAVNADNTYDGEIDIENETGSGSGWTFDTSVLTITTDGNYRVYGTRTQTSNRIVVDHDVTANITLDNVHISAGANNALDLGAGADVILNLQEGTDNITDSTAIGIAVNENASLTLQGAGTLSISNCTVGIGTNDSAGGDLTIDGTELSMAVTGQYTIGIGTMGASGSFGDLSILNAVVNITATNGGWNSKSGINGVSSLTITDSHANIQGNEWGAVNTAANGDVTITNSTVTVQDLAGHWQWGAGITAGAGGDIMIDDSDVTSTVLFNSPAYTSEYANLLTSGGGNIIIANNSIVTANGGMVHTSNAGVLKLDGGVITCSRGFIATDITTSEGLSTSEGGTIQLASGQTSFSITKTVNGEDRGGNPSFKNGIATGIFTLDLNGNNPGTVNPAITTGVSPNGDFVISGNSFTSEKTSDESYSYWTLEMLPPYATDVSIDGIPEVGQTLTGNYTFNPNANGGPESGTTYQWLYSGNQSVLFDNWQIDEALNEPTEPTQFTINEEKYITVIENYHWNVDGTGATPGTIGLTDQDGNTYGPWSAGEYDSDIVWAAYPNILLEPGTYTVVDSGNSTWSHNYLSEDAGFSKIYYKGFNALLGATSTSYSPTTYDLGKMIAFEVTVKDDQGNTGTPITRVAGPILAASEDDPICIVPGCATPQDEGGLSDYTEIDGVRYYHIASAQNLVHIQEHLNDLDLDSELPINFIQTADIDLSEDYSEGWTPIGGFVDPDQSTDADEFKGIYLGNNHTISNLYCTFNDPDENIIDIGIFSRITGVNSFVRDLNVTVAGVSTTNYNYAFFGGIAGRSDGSTLRDCNVSIEGDVVTNSPNGAAGGIVGEAYYIYDNVDGEDVYYGEIDSCSAALTTGSLLTDGWWKYAGGIAGRSSMQLTDCDVTIQEDKKIKAPIVGGIAGFIDKSLYAPVENCIVSGDGSLEVYDQQYYTTYIGGIAGYVSEAEINNCQNSVHLEATDLAKIAEGVSAYAGGIVGYLGPNSILFNCFNSGDVALTVPNNVVTNFDLPGESQGNEYAYAGGIAGYVNGFTRATTIENCENDADITSINNIPTLRAYAGGLVGHINCADGVNAGVTILNSANLGADNVVSTAASTTMTGGLIGSTTFTNFVTPNIVIQNCYNRSQVTSISNGAPDDGGMCVGITAGGIIGAAGKVTLEYTYSTAEDVSAMNNHEGDAYHGGLIGVLYNTLTLQNYYEINDNVTSAVGGKVNGMSVEPEEDTQGAYTGALATELKTKSFYGNGWKWYTSGGIDPQYYISGKPWRITQIDAYANDGYPALHGKPYVVSSGGGGGGNNPPVQSILSQRLGGTDRINTSVAIAEAYNNGPVDNCILSTGYNFPDALSGSSLAKKLNAPILLSGNTAAESQPALEYIRTHLSKSGTLYVLGGTEAVSEEILQALRQMGVQNIVRLFGPDRYATNLAVMKELKVAKGTPVILVTGENFPDSLSISGAASSLGYPVLLCGRDSLSKDTEEFLKSIAPGKVFLIGGNGALSDQIKAQVQTLTGLTGNQIERIQGADRFETALNVAKYFKLKSEKVIIATGTDFPDALSGTTLASKYNTTILLMGGDPDAIKEYLAAQGYKEIIICGGTGVINEKSIDTLLST